MSEDPNAQPSASTVPGGVLITRGMSLRIPAGGLTIGLGEPGQPEMSVVLHVSLDVYPHWLEIALSHLEAAEIARNEALAAWRGGDQERKVRALEAEFTASMQCVVAAAIAVDSFYARVKRHISLPDAVVSAWRTNRTARYRQIAEVLRRAFLIGPRTVAQVRRHLKELFKWRDWSVHPSAEFDKPLWHQDLQVGTE
jgi:hypothetical protein